MFTCSPDSHTASGRNTNKENHLNPVVTWNPEVDPVWYHNQENSSVRLYYRQIDSRTFSWLVIDVGGRSQLWVVPPWEGGYRVYTKVSFARYGEQASKQYSSMAIASVFLSRYLLWIHVLISLWWILIISWNKPFLSTLMWVMVFITAKEANRVRKQYSKKEDTAIYL